MAKGKKFDEYLLIEFSGRLSSAESRAEKKGVIEWFMNTSGVSRGTAYKIRDKIQRGIPYTEVATAKQNRKTRKNDLELQIEKRDALRVSAIKRRPGEDKKWVPTERAIEICEDMGLIERGKYNRFKMDRILAREGLNFKSAQHRKVAWEIQADYPMHVLVVDATPIDHYYMSLDRKVVRYDGLSKDDKHINDYLERDKLSKVWVYYAVDMRTKAFLAMPFASTPIGASSKNPGENAEDWMEFLKWVMLPKKDIVSPLEDRRAPFSDCPVEGIPTILFCDRGSGIGKSSLVGRMCMRLGIQVVTHLPGNPSAKGLVEGRIGAFKRSFECQINPSVIKDINQLIYFYQAWAEHYCKDKGLYDKWLRESLQHPVTRVTPQNLQDVTVSHITRVINGYGCVSIDGEEWFVTWDGKYKGTRATIYRAPSKDGFVYKAELCDRVIVDCTNGRRQHRFEEIKSFPKSEGERNREEAQGLAKVIGGMQDFDDILPKTEDSRVVRMPSTVKKGIETHSAVVTAEFRSVEKAWKWVLNQTGLFFEEIPEESRDTINNLFNMFLREEGFIAGEIAVKMANLINSKKKEGISHG